MDKNIALFILTSILYGLALARYYIRQDYNMIYIIVFCGFLYIYNFLKLSMYYHAVQ